MTTMICKRATWIILVTSLGITGCGLVLGQPHWIHQIAGQPIVPGTGLGGMGLGDSESKLLTLLGTPSYEMPIRTTTGELLDHAFVFRHDGVFLGVYTTGDNHLIHSFRLYDSEFDSDHKLPQFKGVGVGSSETQLRQALGEPDSTREHFTCPESLSSNRHATTLQYPGMSFCVCAANNKVYWIDIP